MPTWPVPPLGALAPKISDHFGFSEQRGRLHAGVDIMYVREPRGALKLPVFARGFFMPDGVPALAFDSGIVTRSSIIGTGGRVEIDHRNGFSTKYMHLLDLRVRVGQAVKEGDPIGTISHNPSPGAFKLNHLHFELLQNGKQIDPEPFLLAARIAPAVAPAAAGMSPILKGAAIGLALAGGAGILFLLLRRARAGGALGSAKHSLYAMPDRWWETKVPRENKLCYRTKTEALRKFMDWNFAVIDDYGGPTAKGSRGEFDALTKYEVAPTDISEALWVALPAPPRGRQFCLDDIDLAALNDTSPGRDHPVGFQLPDYVLEEKLLEQEYERYRPD